LSYGFGGLVGGGVRREQVHSIATIIAELMLESHGLRERAWKLLGEVEEGNIMKLA
jgi:hypothetical protein